MLASPVSSGLVPAGVFFGLSVTFPVFCCPRPNLLETCSCCLIQNKYVFKKKNKKKEISENGKQLLHLNANDSTYTVA